MNVCRMRWWWWMCRVVCVMRMIDERFDAERGVRSERWDDGMR